MDLNLAPSERDGRDPEDNAATRPRNLVLLDQNVPGVDGIDVVHRLRADPHPNDVRW